MCACGQVTFDFEGLSQTLFVVTGSALGMDVSLDYRTIPFGVVVPRNSVERSLTLRNAGDIGTRYQHPYAYILIMSLCQLLTYQLTRDVRHRLYFSAATTITAEIVVQLQGVTWSTRKPS